jgi:type IV secretory pathway VirB10-like protein
MRGIRMRTVLGWMAAMVASALLGAAVYQTVLSKPAAQLDPTATVQTVTREPGPTPTLYRTEVRTVVEPTPIVTVEERVVVQEPVDEVDQPRTANAAPTRTSAPRSTPRATAEREKDDSAERAESSQRAEEEAREAAEEASKAAEDASKAAEDAAESDD